MKGCFSLLVFVHSAFLQRDADQEHMSKLFGAKSGVLGLGTSAMRVNITPLRGQPPCAIVGANCSHECQKKWQSP